MSLDIGPQHCVVAGFSAVLLARIVNWNAVPITRGEIGAVDYSVFEIDENDPSVRLPVAGQQSVALNSGELDNAIFDSLQTGDVRWTVDEKGYNFRFQPDGSTAALFPTAGSLYLAEFRFTPLSGQMFPARWRVRAL